ncbi:hypothetical protein AB0M29_43145 [Streptomyces sp. NPDC051976]
MATPARQRLRRRHLAAGLLLGSAVTLTACGQQHLPAGTTPTTTSASPSSSSSPYVEPGANDGAPHYQENNAGRLPGTMSAADATEAEAQATRIRPVLKHLWQQGTWDPASVRTAMLALGYQERHGHASTGRPGVTLEVRAMDQRFEGDHYVTPAGAQVGLSVHGDACVTAFVQKADYDVQVNGPYPESGCFAPPFAH